MTKTNNKIDKHLRDQFLRKFFIAVIVMIIFVVFMSYALYREYGPGTEAVDYFPEINSDKKT